MSRRRVACLLALVCLFVSIPSLAVPPALDDPLVFSISPTEGQVGNQVLITGVNFGGAPDVRFNGVVALIDAYRPDLGRLVVTVPPGATSGPVTVTDTGTAETSNGAPFSVLPGIYTPSCTIVGSATDPSVAPVTDAVVVALDVNAGRFAGAALTNLAGSYSLGLDPAGEYEIHFIPPAGSPFHEARYPVSCSGAQDHQFALGHELYGRVISSTSTPVENAWVLVEGSGEFGAETLSDAAGYFSMHLAPDVYDLLVQGPTGGRHVSTARPALAISSDTNLGDLQLDTGLLVSGVVRFQDDDATGPAMGASIEQYDFDGFLAGTTSAIASGEFWLPSPAGPGFSLWVSADYPGMLERLLFSIAVVADMELDYPIWLYSSSGQLPRTPVITGIEELVVQPGQRIVLDALHLRGATGSVRFSDGIGGWVDGLNTLIEADRGGVVTTVPPLAATGDVVLRIDGVDSPGYPLTVAPGTFIPGPFATSGIVDDGTGPVEDAFVGILAVDCFGERLVDYDLTAADGSYGVAHGAGDHFMIFLPPVPRGLAYAFVELPGLSGGGTQNVTLQAGHTVTATCVDSGIGTVGGSLPVSDCFISAEVEATDFDDNSLGDDAGGIRLNLPTGEYEFSLEAPFQSRFVTDPGESLIPIAGNIDFGDVGLDSGYLVGGRVVDPLGNGLAGVEVTAVDRDGWFQAGYTQTVGEEGSFLLAVLPGTYDLFFEMPAEHPFYAPPLFALEVWQDYLAYPAVQAEEVGYIEGTVTDTTPAPVPGVPMTAWHSIYGPVDDARTCADGGYLLRAPTGDFAVAASPSEEGYCLADEQYDGHYLNCGSDWVSVTAPATVPGIDFALEPAGSIAGQITDDSASGLSGVMVCASAGNSVPFCAQKCTFTEPGGFYLLEGLPVADDYAVEASGMGLPLECWDDHVNCVGGYDPVAIDECVVTPGIDFLMSWAPGRVPAYALAAGTPMTAAYDQASGVLTIQWQPTCSADNHAAFFGNIGDFSNYVAAECVMGISASQPIMPPPGDVFWVVVGVTGSIQGSYGVDSDLVERPHDGGAQCGYVQNLGSTCVP